MAMGHVHSNVSHGNNHLRGHSGWDRPGLIGLIASEGLQLASDATAMQLRGRRFVQNTGVCVDSFFKTYNCALVYFPFFAYASQKRSKAVLR